MQLYTALLFCVLRYLAYLCYFPISASKTVLPIVRKIIRFKITITRVLSVVQSIFTFN